MPSSSLFLFTDCFILQAVLLTCALNQFVTGRWVDRQALNKQPEPKIGHKDCSAEHSSGVLAPTTARGKWKSNYELCFFYTSVSMNLVYASKTERLSKNHLIVLQILLFHADVVFLFELCLALFLNNFQQHCMFMGHLYTGCKIFWWALKDCIKGFDTHELPASWLPVFSSFFSFCCCYQANSCPENVPHLPWWWQWFLKYLQALHLWQRLKQQFQADLHQINTSAPMGLHSLELCPSPFPWSQRCWRWKQLPSGQLFHLQVK